MSDIFEKLARCETAGEIERLLRGTGHVLLPEEPTEEMIRAMDLRIRPGFRHMIRAGKIKPE